MTKKYEIKQRRTSYTAPASELISAMKKNRWDIAQLISYYIGVIQNNPQVLEVLPPYVVAAMFELSPLEFIKQCDAVIHPHNDSGVENDFVSKRFFELTAAWDKCLIVNPNPSFLEVYKMFTERLVITYSSDEMVRILGSDPKLKKFRFRKMHEITPQDGVNRALVFSREETAESCAQILKFLKEVMVEGAGSNIYLYIPNVFWDNEQETFAKEINSLFAIHNVVLLDAKAMQITPKKKVLFVLRNKIEQNASCIVQEAKLVLDKQKRYLELSHEVTVAYQEITERRKTLIGIYTHAAQGAKAETRVRQPARVYEFSPEISIYVTFFDRQYDGSCRGAYGFRDWATETQRRRNNTQHGALFATPTHGKRLSSEEEAYQYAEKILFINKKLCELIRTKTTEHFKRRAITIKTMWFLCLPFVTQNEEYNHEFCVEFFTLLRKCARELWELPVTAENAKKLVEAASEYVKNQGLSYAAQKRLYEQLALIVDFGRNAHHASVNPFRDLLSVKANQKNREQQKRDALMLSSRDITSIGRLVSVVMNDQMHKMLAIGFLIKLFTAMSTGEVCALRWGDFRKVTNLELHQFLLTKYFAGRETRARAFTNDEQYRVIPSVDRLTKILKKMKSETIVQLAGSGKGDVDIELCPILHCADDPSAPINAEVLNKYIKEILATVAPDSHLLTTTSEDGTVLTTDTSKYRGDLLRANWEHHAVHTMGMSPDEIAYIKGTKPTTVAARNYLDFGCSRSQMVLGQKIERWAALCLNEEENADILCRSGECTGENTIHVEAEPFRCEILLDMEIPSGKTFVDIFTKRGAAVTVDRIRRGKS